MTTTVYIVNSSMMEESSIEGVYARAEDAIAKCRALAEEQAKRQREMRAVYPRKSGPDDCEIREREVEGCEICLRVGYHGFAARAWKIQ